MHQIPDALIDHVADHFRLLADPTRLRILRTILNAGEATVTEIVAAGPFYRAEEAHQDYYKKNPLRYNYYRFNCGRDARLQELWGTEAGGAKSADSD